MSMLSLTLMQLVSRCAQFSRLIPSIGYPARQNSPRRSHYNYGKTPKVPMSELIRQNSHLTPLDIIISCSVCQRSISDIYASPEQIDGLRQGPGLGNGKITRLWLTECGHFTCTKHLTGGGKKFMFPSAF